MASVLCFGDSITQGSVDLDGGWTQRLRRRLDTQFTFPLGEVSFPAHAVFNLGISGDTSQGLLARLEPELAPRQLGEAVIVAVAIGINETAFDLRSGRPEHDLERFAATMAELVAAARRVAEAAGVVLVDCFDELLAGDHTALLHDGLHPNGDGHQLLAERVGEALAPWL
jgi:lysophospholipase L1-like esterase